MAVAFPEVGDLAEIPTGDMPGDRVQISEAHVAKARSAVPGALGAARGGARCEPAPPGGRQRPRRVRGRQVRDRLAARLWAQPARASGPTCSPATTTRAACRPRTTPSACGCSGPQRCAPGGRRAVRRRGALSAGGAAGDGPDADPAEADGAPVAGTLPGRRPRGPGRLPGQPGRDRLRRARCDPRARSTTGRRSCCSSGWAGPRASSGTTRSTSAASRSSSWSGPTATASTWSASTSRSC